jgi:hypothetical protein
VVFSMLDRGPSRVFIVFSRPAQIFTMWPVLCGEPLHYPTEFCPSPVENLACMYLIVWASLIYCLAWQSFAVHHRAHCFHTVHNTSQIAARTLFHNKGSSRVLCRFFPLPSSSGTRNPLPSDQQTFANKLWPLHRLIDLLSIF